MSQKNVSTRNSCDSRDSNDSNESESQLEYERKWKRTYKERCERFKKELVELRTQISELSAENDTLRGECEQLQEAHDSGKCVNKECANKILELQRENEKLNSDITRIEAAKDEEIDEYKDEIESLKREMQEESDKSIDRWNEINTRYKTMEAQYTARIHELEEKCRANNTELEDLRKGALYVFRFKPPINIQDLCDIVLRNIQDVESIFCQFVRKYYVRPNPNIRVATASGDRFSVYDGKDWITISKEIICKKIVLEAFFHNLARAITKLLYNYSMGIKGDTSEISETKQEKLKELQDYAVGIVSANSRDKYRRDQLNLLMKWWTLEICSNLNTDD